MTKHVQTLRELEDQIRQLNLAHGRGAQVTLNEKEGRVELYVEDAKPKEASKPAKAK